ncbi:MAG: YbjN domain-containing protein [Acidimicrobiales bacterium]
MTATGAAALARRSADLDRWFADQVEENPAVLTVERPLPGPHWFVRMKGEEKDVYTVRFHLGQRTLSYETYFMPAPEENGAQLHEHLLRRNAKLYGGSFWIGEEDAIFLGGQIGADHLDADEIDRILGSIYAWVERCFRPALRIGFASRFPA